MNGSEFQNVGDLIKECILSQINVDIHIVTSYDKDVPTDSFYLLEADSKVIEKIKEKFHNTLICNQNQYQISPVRVYPPEGDIYIYIYMRIMLLYTRLFGNQ